MICTTCSQSPRTIFEKYIQITRYMYTVQGGCDKKQKPGVQVVSAQIQNEESDRKV